MAEEFSETGGAAQQQQPPSRPWMRIIMQIVIFQLVMRFFGGNKTPKVKDPVTGEIVPPLQSALYAGEPFDAFMFLSPEPVESWTELTKVGELVMTVPYQTLKSDMWKKDIKTDYNYTMTAEMLESLTMPISEQQRLRRLKTAQQERQPDQTPDPSRTGDAEPAKEPVDEDKTQADQDDSLVTAGDGGGVSGGAARVNANPDDPNVSKFAAMYEELQKGVARSKLGPLDHASVYLTIAVVPHSSYKERSVAEDLYAESSVRDSDLWRISVYSTPVVRWVEPFTTQELQSLLETSSPFTPPSDFSDSASSSKKSAAEKVWLTTYIYILFCNLSHFVSTAAAARDRWGREATPLSWAFIIDSSLQRPVLLLLLLLSFMFTSAAAGATAALGLPTRRARHPRHLPSHPAGACKRHVAP
eukprot:GHVU01118172.1.p1 GENE.GHVU01118172.1~~GHVU01118172.1.p1  ORF type:complete len:415 (+),score=67.41 GHVU01118172.1:484-1728(+)